MDQDPSTAQRSSFFAPFGSLRFIAYSFVVLLVLFFVSILVFIVRAQNTSLAQEITKTPVVEEVTQIPVPTRTQNDREVIGFLPSWTPVKDVHISSLPLTQLIFFGLGVNEDGTIIKFTDEKRAVLEWDTFTSSETKKLLQDAKQENIKFLVSIKNFDNESIDRLISNSFSTKTFSKQLTSLIKEYGLSGVNLDFEYVTDSEFPTHMYLNKFLEQVRSDIKKVKPDSIISIDVNATAVMKDAAYDMVKIGEIVDQVIVMGYDYHTMKSTAVGHIAPLYSSGSTPSINKSIESLQGRVPNEKVILGIPFYGYEWETVSDKIRSTTIEDTGALATYKRIQDLIITRKKDIKTHWDDRAQAPWLSYKQSGVIKQIYYEDTRSIGKKLEYIKEKELGGAAIWALGYEGKYGEVWKTFK